MNENATLRISRLRHGQRGQTMVETVTILFIVSLVMAWCWNMNERNQYLHRHVFPKWGIALDASRSLASELNSAASTDPTTVYNQMQIGQKVVVAVPTPSPSSPNATPPPEYVSRSVTFTLESKAKLSDESYNLTFSYPAVDKAQERAGTLTIPIHRLGEGTPGCDPASGLTTACNQYIVPGQ